MGKLNVYLMFGHEVDKHWVVGANKVVSIAVTVTFLPFSSLIHSYQFVPLKFSLYEKFVWIIHAAIGIGRKIVR